MKKIYVLSMLMLSFLAMAKPKPSNYYELRIYHCEDGKLPDLLNRFQNHTTKLFEKHGMENLGYFTPTKEGNQDLYYILGYPSKEARDASWKAFGADTEWQKVWKESEAAGKIVKNIESVYMTLNKELTKKIKIKQNNPEMLFEMREYFLLPGRQPNIVARFRDHTRKLFEKSHGMKNIMYFDTIEKDGGQPRLLYFLAHKDADAAKKSWDDFRKDPEWIKVRDASEVSGKIVEKVIATYMVPTSFSRIK